jgi:phosphopantetheinyl transferase
MPLLKRIESHPGLQAFLWKIEEPESWLARGIELTPHCQERLLGMKSELHRRGFLSIRHLMAEGGYCDADLFYDLNGKPHLRDGTHISITHSFEMTGIILSRQFEVGIDIEKQRHKILRIAHRFTPLSEYHDLANEEALVRKLTIVWGVKESLYKVMGIHGLSFLNHITVDNFDLEDGRATARVVYGGECTHFNAFFLELEGFTCAYAVRVPAANQAPCP